VDYNINRPAAERGLLNLENKVKIGDVRATLVIQTLTNTAEVTLNAGTSMYYNTTSYLDILLLKMTLYIMYFLHPILILHS